MSDPYLSVPDLPQICEECGKDPCYEPCETFQKWIKKIEEKKMVCPICYLEGYEVDCSKPDGRYIQETEWGILIACPRCSNESLVEWGFIPNRSCE